MVFPHAEDLIQNMQVISLSLSDISLSLSLSDISPNLDRPPYLTRQQILSILTLNQLTIQLMVLFEEKLNQIIISQVMTWLRRKLFKSW
jgi:hypothetical protein